MVFVALNMIASAITNQAGHHAQVPVQVVLMLLTSGILVHAIIPADHLEVAVGDSDFTASGGGIGDPTLKPPSPSQSFALRLTSGDETVQSTCDIFKNYECKCGRLSLHCKFTHSVPGDPEGRIDPLTLTDANSFERFNMVSITYERDEIKIEAYHFWQLNAILTREGRGLGGRNGGGGGPIIQSPGPLAGKLPGVSVDQTNTQGVNAAGVNVGAANKNTNKLDIHLTFKDYNKLILDDFAFMNTFTDDQYKRAQLTIELYSRRNSQSTEIMPSAFSRFKADALIIYCNTQHIFIRHTFQRLFNESNIRTLRTEGFQIHTAMSTSNNAEANAVNEAHDDDDRSGMIGSENNKPSGKVLIYPAENKKPSAIANNSGFEDRFTGHVERMIITKQVGHVDSREFPYNPFVSYFGIRAHNAANMASSTFANYSNLQALEISSSKILINSSTLAHLKNLRELSINVQVVKGHAFEDMRQLRRLILGDMIRVIELEALRSIAHDGSSLRFLDISRVNFISLSYSSRCSLFSFVLRNENLSVYLPSLTENCECHLQALTVLITARPKGNVPFTHENCDFLSCRFPRCVDAEWFWNASFAGDHESAVQRTAHVQRDADDADNGHHNPLILDISVYTSKESTPTTTSTKEFYFSDPVYFQSSLTVPPWSLTEETSLTDYTDQTPTDLVDSLSVSSMADPSDVLMKLKPTKLASANSGENRPPLPAVVNRQINWFTINNVKQPMNRDIDSIPPLTENPSGHGHPDVGHGRTRTNNRHREIIKTNMKSAYVVEEDSTDQLPYKHQPPKIQYNKRGMKTVVYVLSVGLLALTLVFTVFLLYFVYVKLGQQYTLIPQRTSQ